MANRIRGNTIILDAAAAVPFPGSGREVRCAGIAFWASDSTGTMVLAETNSTSDVMIIMASPINSPNMTRLDFAAPVTFNPLTVNTLTAGTAWLYMV